MRVVATLAAAGVAGTISLALAQREIKVQVRTNTDEMAVRREAVQAVPVIRTDIQHIKEQVGDVKNEVKSLDDDIAELRVGQQEILRRLPNRAIVDE